MEYEIVPVTLILTHDGEIKETPCTDEQAMEWFIYATSPDGERKCFLHALDRGVADIIVEMLEVANR